MEDLLEYEYWIISYISMIIVCYDIIPFFFALDEPVPCSQMIAILEGLTWLLNWIFSRSITSLFDEDWIAF